MFGMVSIAGIVLNFVAIPIAAVAVPGLLLSLLVAAISPAAAGPVAAGSGALLGVLDQVAWWGGRLGRRGGDSADGNRIRASVAHVLGLAGWSIAGGTTRSVALRRAALGLAGCVWLLLRCRVLAGRP